MEHDVYAENNGDQRGKGREREREREEDAGNKKEILFFKTPS
jgi:hypothetical protein